MNWTHIRDDKYEMGIFAGELTSIHCYDEIVVMEKGKQGRESYWIISND